MDFFIADLHFGHINVLSFDNRPFVDINIHDETIISNWNDVVGIDDDVYILGDISWYNGIKTINLMNRLNGNLHLIKGNHDSKLLRNHELRKLFVEIVDYKELTYKDGSGIVLSHYPIPCFKNHFHGWHHLYGHVHNSFEWNIMESVKRQMIELYTVPCKMYNVGCMIPYMNYTPKLLDEIVKGGDDLFNLDSKNILKKEIGMSC